MPRNLLLILLCTASIACTRTFPMIHAGGPDGFWNQGGGYERQTTHDDGGYTRRHQFKQWVQRRYWLRQIPPIVYIAGIGIVVTAAVIGYRKWKKEKVSINSRNKQ